MEEIITLLFYKFVEIENPERLAKKHLSSCKSIGVLGKILLAKEGINGSVSGTRKQVEDYKTELKKDEKFSDIVFKEEPGKNHPFTKMSVRVKNEIIRLDKKVDMKKTGKYIKPEELVKFYEENQDVIIVDTRNDYEWKVGKFKNALTFPIKTFRQLPKIAEELADKKDKKIIMYCTGGIRCEKASAYFIQEGFKDVSQLEGGIITFCQKHPNTFWEGGCFVFDKRLVSHVEQEPNPITKCSICQTSCDLLRNCKFNDCDNLVVMCVDCEKKMNGCCSSECLKNFRKHCLEKSVRNQGKRMKVLTH